MTGATRLAGDFSRGEPLPLGGPPALRRNFRDKALEPLRGNLIDVVEFVKEYDRVDKVSPQAFRHIRGKEKGTALQVRSFHVRWHR